MCCQVVFVLSGSVVYNHVLFCVVRQSVCRPELPSKAVSVKGHF